MRVRDFALLALVCQVWAFSNVLGKIVVDDWSIPPIFYSAARFALVTLLTLPWLLPMPRSFWRIAAIGLFMGGGNFALLFIGMQGASPSAAAVVLQLSVPFTTLLSVLVLKERIHWRRAVGVGLTLAGVLIVTWAPDVTGDPLSLSFVAGAALAGSIGAILMKQMEDVPPLRFQAWVGLVSTVALGVLSAGLESGQLRAASAAGWPFLLALLFTAIVVSVFAHTAYYGLIRRYEANLLAPLTLMTPLATIGFGVLLTGDRIDLRMAIGTAITLLGVLVVAMRRKRTTELLLQREAP